MLGLYPCSVDKGWRDEIDSMLQWKDKGIVAIGEIGLDYHETREFAQEQKEAFRVQLELASQWDLPVNIHLRDAWGDLFTILEDCRHLHLRGILHCFSGSFEVYERARRCGDFSVGIGGVVTFKKASLAETVKRIPLEHIVLETDAPYLAPVPHRGQRNESAFLPLVAAKVAELKGLSFEEVEAATTHNAETLYRI
jgi:TatD DNase family protein